MHKKLSLHVLVAAAVMMAAGAHAGVAVEVGSSHENVNNVVGNNHVHSVSLMADIKEGHKLGVSLRNVDAWGAQANELSVRSVNKVSQSVTLDSQVTVGDSAVLTPQNRVSTLATLRMNENLSLGAGVGYSKYGFDVDALTWKGQVGYKVSSLPLSLGADFVWSGDLYGLGSEHRWGVDATWGTAGKWTVSGRYEDGAALFDTKMQPLVDSKRLDTELRYWVGKDWGLKAGAARVSNSAYKSNEVRAGVFFSL